MYPLHVYPPPPPNFSLAIGNSKTGILKDVSELPVKCQWATSPIQVHKEICQGTIGIFNNPAQCEIQCYCSRHVSITRGIDCYFLSFLVQDLSYFSLFEVQCSLMDFPQKHCFNFIYYKKVSNMNFRDKWVPHFNIAEERLKY